MTACAGLDRPTGNEISAVTQGNNTQFRKVQITTIMPVHQEKIAGLQVLEQFGTFIGGQCSPRVLALPAQSMLKTA